MLHDYPDLRLCGVQAISRMLDQLDQDDRNLDDGFKHSSAEIFHYLRAVL
jgi:hypothetical protein